MRPTRRQVLASTASLCALAVPMASLHGQASGWPDKPIRIVVPGGPGSVTDIRARWLAVADTIGRRVSVDGITGVAVDLDVDGALLLQDGERRHRVVAGEVGVV